MTENTPSSNPNPSIPAYNPPAQPQETPLTPSAPAQQSGMSPYVTPSASPQLTKGQGEGVSDLAIDILRRTKGWVRLCSVIGFIFAGLMILIGIMMVAGGSMMASAVRHSEGAAFSVGYAIGMMLVYVVLAILYIYPSIKLWQYASSIGRLLNSHSSIDLETALDKQRSFWKYTGIIVILVIIFYAVVFLIAAIGFAAVNSTG